MQRHTDPICSPFKGVKGIKRLTNATRYSVAGFKAAWQNEAAFREELIACAILAPAALLLGNTGVERALLLGSLLLVLIAELINSAIESVVDRIGFEAHELSGRAKDIGSATVLLAIILAVVTWGLVVL